jgi:hypothetical protein
MTKQLWIFLAGAAAAWAQGQTGWIATSGSKTVAAHVALEGQTGPVVGKPLAATEVRRSEQVLSDGTRIEGSDTSRFYRDSQGRMRSESPNRVEIYDPVAGCTYDLDPQHNTYARSATDANTVMIAVAGSSTRVSSTSGNAPPDRPSHADLGIPFQAGKQAITVREELPPQTINGIPARGSRITSTVPAGVVGNDRDFRVVNERWFSDDLQILLKTTNSDPRFGTSTYELTNIVQGPPDPGLFQIPAGYTPRPSGH